MLKLAHVRRDENAARLLRLRFETIDQVRRHFYPVGGRSLVFFPAVLGVRQSESVVLDVSFAGSDQHCLLRGVTMAPAESDSLGRWLEFPGDSVVATLYSAAQSARRKNRRHPTDLLASVKRGDDVPSACRILDVGMGGARLSGAPFTAQPGEMVRLSPFGPGALSGPGAQVIWTRGSELGVRFSGVGTIQRTAVAALVELSRKHSELALEVPHSRICRCAEGGPVVDPPLPPSVRRSTGSG